METVIEELLTAGLFRCSRCEQLLTAPVWHTSDNTYLCNDCYHQRKQDFPSALKDTRLTRILEKLLLPCQYRNEGCEKTIPYSDYQKHVRGCPHAIQACLLTKCQWRGTTKTLIMHLCDEHPDIVLDEKDGVFPLQLRGEETEAINVVQTQARFITRIKVHAEKVQVAIFNFDHELKKDVGEYLLEYDSDPDAGTWHKCNISDDIGSLQTLGGESGTEIIPHSRFEVSSLRLRKIGGKKPTISKELLRYVICSNCKKYLQTPFLECKLGHYTCDTCFKKSCCRKCNTPQVRIVKEDTVLCCQICKSLISKSSDDLWDFQEDVYFCSMCINVKQGQKDTRYTCIRSSNFYDTLLGQFSLPCQFEALGCKFAGPWFGKQRRHEEVCDYGTLTCPQANCGRVLRYPEMMLHMMTDHAEACVAADTQYFMLKLQMDKDNFKFFLVCHNKLFVHEFRLCVTTGAFGCVDRRKDSYKWHVSEIQGYGNDDFVFAISMEGCTGHLLSLQHSCGSPMILQADGVKEFNKEDELSYRLKVTRRGDSK